MGEAALRTSHAPAPPLEALPLPPSLSNRAHFGGTALSQPSVATARLERIRSQGRLLANCAPQGRPSRRRPLAPTLTAGPARSGEACWVRKALRWRRRLAGSPCLTSLLNAPCFPCSPSGWFASNWGSPQCNLCPSNSYSNLPGAAECTACGAGAVTPEGSGAFSCTFCPKGFYAAAEDAHCAR